MKADGLHLWNRLAQEEVGRDLGDDERIQFSPDGKRLVTYDDRGEKEPFRLALWDLQTYRRVALLPLEIPLETRYGGGPFSPDSRWLVTLHDYPEDGRVLEVWDSAAGKRLSRYDLGARRRSIVLAPDSSSLVLNEWGPMGGEPALVTVTLLEMPSAKVRWQRKFPPKPARVRWMGPNGIQRHNPDDFRFGPDGNTVIAFSSLHAEWEYLDIRTGETLKTVHLLDTGARRVQPERPVASPDGRWLLVSTRVLDPPSVWDSKWLGWVRRWLPARHEPNTLTELYASASGQEMLRLQIDGPSNAHLAPDGQIVLTDTSRPEGDGRRLQAWPVPSQRPWTQICAIPLGCAATLLALRWAWRRWRKPAPLKKPVPTQEEGSRAQ